MTLIPTTATALEKLRRLAKTHRKSSGGSLAAALDHIANEHGYSNWKHVTQCREQTAAAPAWDKPLPIALEEFLNACAMREPMSPASHLAMQDGLVFALDVKDAESLALGDDIVECEDAKWAAAGTLLKVLLHSIEPETGVASLNAIEPDEIIQTALEDLMNYRLFRYTGLDVPVSLEEAFARVLRRSFFAPTHLWLKGRFINMVDVSEIRVDGRIVWSSMPSSGTRPSMSVYSAAAANEKGPHGVTDATELRGAAATGLDSLRDKGLIPRLDVVRLAPGIYEFAATYHGSVIMTDAGFSSIREALEAATDVTGDIRGYEVAYAGIVVGTYALEVLRTSAEQIAQNAVETVASLSSR